MSQHIYRYCYVTVSKPAQMHKAVVQNKSSTSSEVAPGFPWKGRKCDHHRHDMLAAGGRVQKKSIIILLDRTKDVKYRCQSHEPDQRSRLQLRNGGGPQHVKEATANQSAVETFTHPPLNHRYPHCSPKWQAKSSCCCELNVLHGDNDMTTSTTVQTKYKLGQ